MQLYYKIRSIVFVFIVLTLGVCYLLMDENVYAEEEKNLESKNIEADQLYLKWLLNASIISKNLKDSLNKPEIIEYIASQSQFSFNNELDNNLVESKTLELFQNLNKNFIKKQLESNNFAEFKIILNKLITPEFQVFVNSKNANQKEDHLYFDFLSKLSQIKTPIGTTLKEWMLRFLTSESLLVGLPMLQKFQENNKSFFDLDLEKQKDAIDKISIIVSEQFLSNLRSVSNKYNFDIPEELSEIIYNKIYNFLLLKLSKT